MRSSWKELTSSVRKSRSRVRSATSHTGVPMLPAASVRLWQCASICSMSSAVVVFPFVPVMAMLRQTACCQPSSISLITGTARATNSLSNGCDGGTPGLTTARSNDPPGSFTAPRVTQTPCVESVAAS